MYFKLPVYVKIVIFFFHSSKQQNEKLNIPRILAKKKKKKNQPIFVKSHFSDSDVNEGLLAYFRYIIGKGLLAIL